MQLSDSQITADLRTVLERAQREAARRQNVFVDVEHLWLALVRYPGTTVTSLFAARQLDTEALYAGVAEAVGMERDSLIAIKGYSKSARAALQRAASEARQLGHQALDTGHLLLGLMSEEYGAVHEVLSNTGLTPDDVRAYLRDHQPQAEPSSPAIPAIPNRAEPEVIVIPTRRKSSPRRSDTTQRSIPWLPILIGLLAVYLLVALPGGSLFTFLFVLAGWIFSVTLHEFAHALVAYLGGDHSVKDKGYLSFNPLKYTHPMLSIGLPLLFLAMGGIGLPGGAVYIERHRLRSKWWSAAVSAAGPTANLLLALVLSLPFMLGWVNIEIIGFQLWFGQPADSTSLWDNADLWSAVAFLIMLQITATIFNLFPIPPFDGFGILEPFLDQRTRMQMLQIGSYGLFLVFLALWFIPPVANSFWDMIFDITHALQIPDDLVREGFSNFMFWRDPP